MHHGSMTVCGASSGGDDVIPAIETDEDILLDFSQGHVPVHVDDILQRSTMGNLDKDVRINKIKRHQFSQNDANGTLACSRHPNQYDIGYMLRHIHFGTRMLPAFRLVVIIPNHPGEKPAHAPPRFGSLAREYP